MDVLRIEDGAITEIITFGYGLFPAFGSPAILDADPRSNPSVRLRTLDA